jgi:hypothetical protein
MDTDGILLSGQPRHLRLPPTGAPVDKCEMSRKIRVRARYHFIERGGRYGDAFPGVSEPRNSALAFFERDL